MENLQNDYEGLIFDMDGTLADTMPTHFIAWSKTFKKYNINFSEDRFYALGGVPAEAIITMLAKEQGHSIDAVAIAIEKEKLFEFLLGEVQPVKEVKAIAQRYRELLPMAVATGSPMWVAEKILTALGMRNWFAAVVTADCIENPKPAPDIYVKAARLIGVDPQRCHAFEDTELGLQAASSAGMDVININTLRR
ncbi:MAG: HAD-IA family hydrolase [Verrucomicrobiota bacterium]|nr:HAD-IA family hydrolase [Verrucomicrobiota bacterium]MEC8650362.1 HAD-IA family hydrolase [Verrucomicrobiota bacterium]MEC9227779.1 HAD-IA family hydrolase [Verrucomicrobiota bacterium]